jgi:hypothetical protein
MFLFHQWFPFLRSDVLAGVNLLLGMGALGSESEPEISENIF